MTSLRREESDQNNDLRGVLRHNCGEKVKEREGIKNEKKGFIYGLPFRKIN